MADVAVFSRNAPSGPAVSAPSSPHSPNASVNPQTNDTCSFLASSQRNGSIFRPNVTMPTDLATAQHLYLSHYFRSPSSSIFQFNQSSGGLQPPPAHFSTPYLPTYFNQQFSPPPAQNSSISTFIVPNSPNVTTHSGSYLTANTDAYQNFLSGTAATHASNSNVSRHSVTSSPPHNPSSPSSVLSGRMPSPHNQSSLSANSTASLEQEKSFIRSPTASQLSSKENASTTNFKESNNNVSPYSVPAGKEGSLKHRILKPPNISLTETANPSLLHMEPTPMSAPPIPCVRKDEFSRRFSASSLSGLSNDEPQFHLQDAHLVAKQGNKFFESPSRVHPVHNSADTGNTMDFGSDRLQYPIYFHKGSIIQLGDGKVKKVEEMSTEDFLESANKSPDLRADKSIVRRMEERDNDRSVLLKFSVGQNENIISVEAPLEHPFFVFNRGWASCSPERSMKRYGLHCHKLKVGDECVSLTNKSIPLTSNAFKNLPAAKSHATSAFSNGIKVKRAFLEDEDHSEKTTVPPNEAPSGRSSDPSVDNRSSSNKNADDVPTVPFKRLRRHSAPNVLP